MCRFTQCGTTRTNWRGVVSVVSGLGDGALDLDIGSSILSGVLFGAIAGPGSYAIAL
jgi:hypothetical protein